MERKCALLQLNLINKFLIFEQNFKRINFGFLTKTKQKKRRFVLHLTYLISAQFENEFLYIRFKLNNVNVR